MLTYIKEVFITATFRQSSITFLGTITNGLLGAAFYIVIARVLGPTDFGLLAISIATITLVADIADLGTDTGIVRFVGKYLNSSKDLAFKYLKLALEFRVFTSLVVIMVGWSLSPILAYSFFQKGELLQPLKMAFFGVLSAQVYSFSTSTYQAFQRFWHWSFFQIGTNVVRLLIILILLSRESLNLSNTLIVYIAIPFLGFIISLLFLPRKILTIQNEWSVATDFFHYSKWVALSTLIAALSSRLDTFISARLLTTEEVGYYAAATQLVIAVPQIAASLGTVFAPKMAGFNSKIDFVNYLKKVQFLVIGISLLGLIFSPVVIFFIPLLYGVEYANTVPLLFLILLLAMLIFLISIPIHNAIYYYFANPRLFIYVSVVHLLIVAMGGLILISIYGNIGAALTVLIGSVFNFLVPLVWLLKKIL